MVLECDIWKCISELPPTVVCLWTPSQRNDFPFPSVLSTTNINIIGFTILISITEPCFNFCLLVCFFFFYIVCILTKQVILLHGWCRVVAL